VHKTVDSLSTRAHLAKPESFCELQAKNQQKKTPTQGLRPRTPGILRFDDRQQREPFHSILKERAALPRFSGVRGRSPCIAFNCISSLLPSHFFLYSGSA
jgi:hypothetical protein